MNTSDVLLQSQQLLATLARLPRTQQTTGQINEALYRLHRILDKAQIQANRLDALFEPIREERLENILRPFRGDSASPIPRAHVGSGWRTSEGVR